MVVTLGILGADKLAPDAGASRAGGAFGASGRDGGNAGCIWRKISCIFLMSETGTTSMSNWPYPIVIIVAAVNSGEHPGGNRRQDETCRSAG